MIRKLRNYAISPSVEMPFEIYSPNPVIIQGFGAIQLRYQ
jgi:hypothetical protein